MGKVNTILMVKSTSGSPDGITVTRYAEGGIYDVPESLANVFVNQMKVAAFYEEPVIEKEIIAPKKAIVAAPENKNMQKSPVNKTQPKIRNKNSKSK